MQEQKHISYYNVSLMDSSLTGAAASSLLIPSPIILLKVK